MSAGTGMSGGKNGKGMPFPYNPDHWGMIRYGTGSLGDDINPVHYGMMC